MKTIHQEFLTGERALFQGKDLQIFDTTFADGESPGYGINIAKKLKIILQRPVYRKLKRIKYLQIVEKSLH